MVACAAVSVQLCYPNWMQPQSAGSAVDQLKQQLLLAVENANITEATDVIAKLEKSGLTKEILEVTRVGAVVNDIRKRLAESAPELSKRCRALIKSWQKLADPRPASSCGSSSNSGTPNLLSPAVRRGLTPGTPARGARVTSAGLVAGSRSNLTSPSVGTPNGGYAPQQHARFAECSPRNGVNSAANMHKSYSVGADLARKAVEDSLSSANEETVRNGKRKAEHSEVTGIGSNNGLSASTSTKRPKCASAVASPAASHQSVVAARRANVQSTSELVAQLSENLPQYMTIDLSEHAEKTKRDQRTAAAAVQNDQRHPQSGSHQHSTASHPAVSATETSRKKEKRSRPKKPPVEVVAAREESQTKEAASTVEPGDSAAQPSSSSNSSSVEAPMRNGKYDWNALLPTLETLRRRTHPPVHSSPDPRKSYIINFRGREVLALPYADVGVPDFLEYKYPDSANFYAEENFIYGAPRPD